ncbi:MAG: pentapeptide repeat-containing protein, partial [Byssovorax sp.]
FDRANLDGADLSACDATGARLDRVTIRGGMMIRTDLTGASLEGANLLDVLASKSRIAGASFTGANLYRADLSRVVADADTTFAEAEVGHVRFLPKADVPPRGEP